MIKKFWKAFVQFAVKLLYIYSALETFVPHVRLTSGWDWNPFYAKAPCLKQHLLETALTDYAVSFYVFDIVLRTLSLNCEYFGSVITADHHFFAVGGMDPCCSLYNLFSCVCCQYDLEQSLSPSMAFHCFLLKFLTSTQSQGLNLCSSRFATARKAADTCLETSNTGWTRYAVGQHVMFIMVVIQGRSGGGWPYS